MFSHTTGWKFSFEKGKKRPAKVYSLAFVPKKGIVDS
jgi:hypothetical protein